MNVQFVILSADGSTSEATTVTSQGQTIMDAEDLQNLMILARTSTTSSEGDHVVKLLSDHQGGSGLENGGVQFATIEGVDGVQEQVLIQQDNSADAMETDMVASHQPGMSIPLVLAQHQDHEQGLESEITDEQVPMISEEPSVFKKRKKPRYTPDKKFPCEVCGKKFPSTSNLTRHKRVHTGEKPYKCNYCLKAYAQIDHLKRHEGTHTGQLAYSCPDCGKKYQEKFRLVIHMRTHTGERPFVCTLCKKGFTTARALVKHKRWHTGERNFECEFCLKRFVDYAGLSTHRKIHTGDKPHKCSHCERAFIARKDLISHERLHTGFLPFPCETCHKKFPRKTALVQHMKTHTDDKPFECRFCHKTFRQKPSLRNHVLIHTDEWPFDCDFCFKRFRRKDSMETHRRKHLDNQDVPAGFKCKACDKSFRTRKSLRSHERYHQKTSARATIKSENNYGNVHHNAAADANANNNLEGTAENNQAYLTQSLHQYAKLGEPNGDDDSEDEESDEADDGSSQIVLDCDGRFIQIVEAQSDGVQTRSKSSTSVTETSGKVSKTVTNAGTQTPYLDSVDQGGDNSVATEPHVPCKTVVFTNSSAELSVPGEYPDRRESYIPSNLYPSIPQRERRKSV